jgi:CHAT domain-containing protein
MPWHAAGIYKPDDSRDCVSDYALSSYAPLLSAVIRARKGLKPLSRAQLTALVTAVQAPERGYPDKLWKKIPYTVTEAGYVVESMEKARFLKVERLVDQEVKLSNVKETLKKIHFLHNSSHGEYNRIDPLKSRLVFQTEDLTVGDLMQLNTPNAVLAYLSACETAVTGNVQPDQAVSLAASMLFTGFKGVIATMW